MIFVLLRIIHFQMFVSQHRNVLTVCSSAINENAQRNCTTVSTEVAVKGKVLVIVKDQCSHLVYLNICIK